MVLLVTGSSVQVKGIFFMIIAGTRIMGPYMEQIGFLVAVQIHMQKIITLMLQKMMVAVMDTQIMGIIPLVLIAIM